MRLTVRLGCSGISGGFIYGCIQDFSVISDVLSDGLYRRPAKSA